MTDSEAIAHLLSTGKYVLAKVVKAADVQVEMRRVFYDSGFIVRNVDIDGDGTVALGDSIDKGAEFLLDDESVYIEVETP